MKTGYTHVGTFHADDVLSAVLLKKVFPEIEIRRVRKEQLPNRKDDSFIVFDLGWDKGYPEFDHHQDDGQIRADGTKYAAFGLLWKEFGHELCVDEEAWKKFDETFVLPVDKQDNGIEMSTLSCAIGSFNPDWDSDKTQDECFVDAMAFAEKAFDNTLGRINSARRAIHLVREAADKSDGVVIELPKYMPWEDVIINEYPEALYVVWYDKARNVWNVRTVPDAPCSFSGRKLFPVEWLGNPDRSLGMNFCHVNNFILACDSREQALNVAHIAAAR